MSNPWFRFYAEFAHDPKVQIMSEPMQRRLVMLMCLRCSNVTVTLRVTEIAFALRVTDVELAETKALFIGQGFIDEQWNLVNWDKRQFASDSSAARVARHREKLRQASNVTAPLPKRPSNVLDTDTDTDKKKKKKKSPQSGLVLKPEDVPAQVWDDFIRHRVAKRAPLTATALAGIAREAKKAGLPLAEAISMSCARGWQGFNAEWVTSAATPKATKEAYL